MIFICCGIIRKVNQSYFIIPWYQWIIEKLRSVSKQISLISVIYFMHGGDKYSRSFFFLNTRCFHLDIILVLQTNVLDYVFRYFLQGDSQRFSVFVNHGNETLYQLKYLIRKGKSGFRYTGLIDIVLWKMGLPPFIISWNGLSSSFLRETGRFLPCTSLNRGS